MISSELKAFIERFYCLAGEDNDPPFGRYEKYPVKDSALLMTSADDFFRTFEQAAAEIPTGGPAMKKHRICKGHMSLGKIFTALVTVNK